MIFQNFGKNHNFRILKQKGGNAFTKRKIHIPDSIQYLVTATFDVAQVYFRKGQIWKKETFENPK